MPNDTSRCSRPDDCPDSGFFSRDSGNANELTDVIDGITCTLVDRDSDDCDDLFVVRVRDAEQDEEVHVYLTRHWVRGYNDKMVHVDAPAHLPREYGQAARKFVARVTDDFGDY